jgi:hypothetical protein
MCYEGLVSVTYNNKTVKLPPGKTFRVVDKILNQCKISQIKLHHGYKRIKILIVFLLQVIAELERQYNITIKLDGVDAAKLFTWNFYT